MCRQTPSWNTELSRRRGICRSYHYKMGNALRHAFYAYLTFLHLFEVASAPLICRFWKNLPKGTKRPNEYALREGPAQSAVLVNSCGKLRKMHPVSEGYALSVT